MASDAPAPAAGGTSDDGCSSCFGCVLIVWGIVLLPGSFILGYQFAVADGMDLFPALAAAAAVTILGVFLVPGAIAAPFAYFSASSDPPESFWANLVPCWMLVHTVLACLAILGGLGYLGWRILWG